MDIIPVIDLKSGEVVRAVRGDRQLYAPIATPLAKTSAPADVVAGFLALHPFRAIYIADLDAIEAKSDHFAVIAALEAAFPSVTFWVDAGIATLDQAQAFFGRHRGELVLGSESLGDVSLPAALAKNPRVLLSLDFRGDAFLGPPQLCESPALWPARLIVMTLARVGSHAGPDLDRLSAIAAKAEAAKTQGAPAVFAAGGVRDAQDLALLAKANVSGALVASALHDGQLDASALAQFDPP